MKAVVRFGIAGFLTICATGPTSSGDGIEDSLMQLEGLEASYGQTSEIAFYLVNRSDSAFAFYCGVEHFLDETWQEVLLSVDPDAPPKTVKLRQVPEQERALVSWKPSRTPQANRPGKYRFVCTALPPDDRGETQVRSTEFELRE